MKRKALEIAAPEIMFLQKRFAAMGSKTAVLFASLFVFSQIAFGAWQILDGIKDTKGI